MSEETQSANGNTFRYRADSPPPETAPVQAKDFRCPNCGGPVHLALPGKSQTVRCSHCSSILAPDHEVLQIVEKYNDKYPYKMWVPLGAEGVLNGVKYKCVGMVIRQDDEGGEWSEYLLFNPYFGYRYLVESSGHWTLVETSPNMGYDASGRPGWQGPTGKVKIAGKKFKYFTSYTAKVKSIIGEFPWQASIGETNGVTEYINPPYQLSCETVSAYHNKEGKKVEQETLLDEAHAWMERENEKLRAEEDDDLYELSDAVEVVATQNGYWKKVSESNWSVGEYKYPEEIQKAFGLEEMPQRIGFGMCEPNPWRPRKLLALVLSSLMMLGTCTTCTISAGQSEEKIVLDKTLSLNTADFEYKTEGTTDYLEFSFEPGSIELDKETNVEFAFAGNLSQEWVSLNIFMINEKTGKGFIYDGELSYYYGGSGEDSWSEGGNTSDFTTEKMPPGEYYVFVAGATNVGVLQFKANLARYGTRAAIPQLMPTSPLGKADASKGALHSIVAAPAKPVATPPATGAKDPAVGKGGKYLPVDFPAKAAAPKLVLSMKAKRDVLSLGWAIVFFFWLIYFYGYYAFRYRAKEGER